LSPAWIEAATAITRDYITSAGATRLPGVRLNQVVTEVPFQTENLQAHLDLTGPHPVIGLGHLENPTAVITLDYATAREVFALGHLQAGVQAFMTGRVKVEGDFAGLLSYLTGSGGDADGTLAALAASLRSITE
jgi:hypothetical protein